MRRYYYFASNIALLAVAFSAMVQGAATAQELPIDAPLYNAVAPVPPSPPVLPSPPACATGNCPLPPMPPHIQDEPQMWRAIIAPTLTGQQSTAPSCPLCDAGKLKLVQQNSPILAAWHAVIDRQSCNESCGENCPTKCSEECSKVEQCPKGCAACPSTACNVAAKATTCTAIKVAACPVSKAACDCSACKCDDCDCKACKCGDACPGKPTPKNSSKIDHLVQAARHLEAAGLADEAKLIHERVQVEKRLEQKRLLDLKLIQVRRLQAEIAELQRGLNPVQQVMLGTTVAEVASEEAEGLEETLQDLGGANVTLQDDGGCLVVLSRKNASHLADALRVLRVGNKVKVIAEPQIITISEQTAKFVSGGEIPFAVKKDDGEYGIEYRPFGVAVEFKPTVQDGNVNLDVNCDISQRVETKTAAGEAQPAIAKLCESKINVDLSPGELAVILAPQSESAQKSSVRHLLIVAPEVLKPAPVAQTIPGMIQR